MSAAHLVSPQQLALETLIAPTMDLTRSATFDGINQHAIMADYAGQEQVVRQGHVQGGLFFLAWGAYWAFYLFHTHLLQQFPNVKQHGQKAATAAVSYTFPSWSGTPYRIIEPIAKLCLGLYGVCWAFQHQLACLHLRGGECWPLLDAAGHLDEQHMGSFFHGMMSGILLLAGLYGLLAMAAPVPSAAEHGFHIVGFMVESLVFLYHIKPSPLDHMVHMMAGYCWLGLVGTTALQCLYPRDFLLACGRAMLMLLQGAWSIQNAYIMFSGLQVWDKDAPGSPHYVPMLFGAYVMATVVLFTAAYLAVACVYHKLDLIALPSNSSWTCCSSTSRAHASSRFSFGGGIMFGQAAAAVTRISAAGSKVGGGYRSCDLELPVSSNWRLPAGSVSQEEGEQLVPRSVAHLESAEPEYLIKHMPMGFAGVRNVAGGKLW